MKRQLKPIIAALLLIFSGCGGTGVGNPGNILSTAGPANQLASQSILTSVCTVLTGCSGSLSMSACESGIQNTSGIETSLGLSAGSYPNYGGIESAEQAGLIGANQNAASLCEAQIGVLSCSDSAVIAAYQPGQTNPFSNVAGMMPTSSGSCGSVF